MEIVGILVLVVSSYGTYQGKVFHVVQEFQSSVKIRCSDILSLVTECCPGSKVAQSCITTSDLIYKLGMLLSR